MSHVHSRSWTKNWEKYEPEMSHVCEWTEWTPIMFIFAHLCKHAAYSKSSTTSKNDVIFHFLGDVSNDAIGNCVGHDCILVGWRFCLSYVLIFPNIWFIFIQQHRYMYFHRQVMITFWQDETSLFLPTNDILSVNYLLKKVNSEQKLHGGEKINFCGTIHCLSRLKSTIFEKF